MPFSVKERLWVLDRKKQGQLKTEEEGKKGDTKWFWQLNNCIVKGQRSADLWSLGNKNMICLRPLVGKQISRKYLSTAQDKYFQPKQGGGWHTWTSIESSSPGKKMHLVIPGDLVGYFSPIHLKSLCYVKSFLFGNCFPPAISAHRYNSPR